MGSVRGWMARLRGSFGKSRREHDLAAEFEAHFQLHVDDNLRAGMDPSQARREAALKFGSVDSAKEAVREMSTARWLERARRDFLYAIRGLRRNPGFAAAAIGSLALGIGASISIFAVADSLLLRPLPFREPERIAMVWSRNVQRKDTEHNVISPGDFRDWKAQNSVFESMAAFADGRAVLADGDRVEELENRFATADLLPMLGVQPFRGRFFTAAEDVPNGPNAIVISYRLWQSWFGGEESAVGRKIQIRSQPGVVIGVLPPEFSFRNRNIDIWEPIGIDPARDYRATSGRYPLAAARLKPGVSLPAAQAQMTAIALRLEQTYPKFNKNWTVNLEPLRDSMVREVRSSVQALLLAVGLLLAVSCANVANLLLARSTARRREIAVRVAIGGLPGRIAGLVMGNALALAIAGSAIAFAIAVKLVPRLSGLAHGMASQDPWVMTTSAVVLVSVSILAAAVPTRRALRIDPIAILKSE